MCIKKLLKSKCKSYTDTNQSVILINVSNRKTVNKAQSTWYKFTGSRTFPQDISHPDISPEIDEKNDA